MFCIVDHLRSDLTAVDSFVFDAGFALHYPLSDSFGYSRVVLL